jgi:hypothetical protein
MKQPEITTNKTREDYIHIKERAKGQRHILLGYTAKQGGVVRIGIGSTIVDLTEDDKNLRYMEKTEQETEGFMFWHNTQRSDEFLKENGRAITDLFTRALEAE